MGIIGSLLKTNLNISVTPNNIATLTLVRVYRVFLTNSNTSVKTVRFYDRATSPTVGTYAPLKVFTVQPNSTFIIIDYEHCLFNSLTKLWVAATDGGQDTDTTFTGNNIRIDIDYQLD